MNSSWALIATTYLLYTYLLICKNGSNSLKSEHYCKIVIILVCVCVCESLYIIFSVCEIIYLDLGTGVQLASLHTDKDRELLFYFIITIVL